MRPTGWESEQEIRERLKSLGGWDLLALSGDGVERVRELVKHLVAFVEARSQDAIVARAKVPLMSDTDRMITPRLEAWRDAAEHLGTNSVAISSLLSHARIHETAEHLCRLGEYLRTLESGGVTSDRLLLPLLMRLGESLEATTKACTTPERGPDEDLLKSYDDAAKAAAWPLLLDDGWKEDALKLVRLLVLLRCAFADRLRPCILDSGSGRLRLALPYLDAYIDVQGKALANDPSVKIMTHGALPMITTRGGMRYPNPVDLVRFLCLDLESSTRPHPDLVPGTTRGARVWHNELRPLFASLCTLQRVSSLPPPPGR